jgi:hypothetical protein
MHKGMLERLVALGGYTPAMGSMGSGWGRPKPYTLNPIPEP